MKRRNKKICPLRFQAGCSKRRLNLPFIFCVYFVLYYFCVPDAWLFCVVVNLVIRVSLGSLYIFVSASPGFDFVLSVPVKKFDGKSISEMTCFESSGM